MRGGKKKDEAVVTLQQFIRGEMKPRVTCCNLEDEILSPTLKIRNLFLQLGREAKSQKHPSDGESYQEEKQKNL